MVIYGGDKKQIHTYGHRGKLHLPRTVSNAVDALNIGVFILVTGYESVLVYHQRGILGVEAACHTSATDGSEHVVVNIHMTSSEGDLQSTIGSLLYSGGLSFD